MTAEIEIQLASTVTHLPDDEELRKWASATLRDAEKNSVVIRLVDSEESRQLNNDYRGLDKPTNVLSFPFSAPAEIAGNRLLGDIVICAPVVEQEAREQHKPVAAHWAHMVVHGMLHLQGYDHLDDEEAEEMERLERRILATLGVPDPYST
ncbi:MAG: rRNA maturation RNase YbeY [Pseudomonadota bacterium]